MIMNSSTNLKTFALRLRPGDDVIASITEFVKLEKIAAGFVVSCVGSLTDATLRFLHAKVGTLTSRLTNDSKVCECERGNSPGKGFLRSGFPFWHRGTVGSSSAHEHKQWRRRNSWRTCFEGQNFVFFLFVSLI
jgi:hypothetical protein